MIEPDNANTFVDQQDNFARENLLDTMLKMSYIASNVSIFYIRRFYR